MSFSMTKASIPAIEIGLTALSGVLDKAQEFATTKKVDPSVLLGTRLCPDMFALTRQVQVASELAKTVAFIKTLDASKIDGASDREITFPLGPTNKGHMKGDDYLNHFVLPNVYFHLTAAYAILRHCGVEIGKQDYLGAIPLKML